MANPRVENDKLNVFISYSRDDLECADQFDAALSLYGFGTTIDRHGISGGTALQRAREANDEAGAAEHSAPYLADLVLAMDMGYPFAFNSIAYAFEYGLSVEKDATEAGDLYLEFYNRVMACCWAPVAGHLLAEEEKHDKTQVRRVVRDLTLWAAALGSEPSRALLAELAASGTIEQVAPLPDAKLTDLPPWLRD